MLKYIALLVFISFIFNVCGCNRLYYKEYHLTHYCNEETTRVIELGTIDAETVAILYSAPDHEDCELTQNCSIAFKPPPEQAILISPEMVTIDHAVGSLSIFVDDIQVANWDGNVQFNRSKPVYFDSVRDGYAVITFRMRKVASTWRHVKFQLVFTAFISLSYGESCPHPFYHDCGNKRCIREALRCDNYNNCGNIKEESNCGMEMASIIVLVSFIIVSGVFGLVVFCLQQRTDDAAAALLPKPGVKIVT